MPPVISVKNLTYIYPYAAKPVLQDISLEIQGGELICLLGSNGCGKSTLIKLMIQELKPSAGKILLKQGINFAYIAQNMDQILFIDLTIQENLDLMRIYFSHPQEAQTYLEKYHKKLPLYLDQPVKFLSGGEKQALALAVKLFHKPALLYLDEHTSALDPAAEKELMALTYQKTKEQNITTIMCTHRLDLAIHYSTRIIGLNQGKIAIEKINTGHNILKKDLEKIYL